jgi:hypothetical protein
MSDGSASVISQKNFRITRFSRENDAFFGMHLLFAQHTYMWFGDAICFLCPGEKFSTVDIGSVVHRRGVFNQS